jgi:hypothetical protein
MQPYDMLLLLLLLCIGSTLGDPKITGGAGPAHVLTAASVSTQQVTPGATVLVPHAHVHAVPPGPTCP